jgi:hypothetical protein
MERRRGGAIAPILDMGDGPKAEVVPITEGQKPFLKKNGRGLPSTNPKKPSKKKKKVHGTQDPVVEYHDLKDDPYINKPILQIPENPRK